VRREYVRGVAGFQLAASNRHQLQYQPRDGRARETHMPDQDKHTDQTSSGLSFADLARQIAELGRAFYGRGWVLGTSGNFSAVLRREPLRLAISSSGVHKGDMEADDVIQVDEAGTPVAGLGRPSAETFLHLAVVRTRGAAAVLHTHSIWSTLLSDIGIANGGLAIEGFEMLKGLDGVATHDHSEWLPILENSQDMPALARAVEECLQRYPECHGFLLRRHGLYTWGNSLSDARRHVEILEFLLEVAGRQRLP
jgi:methylthioribulose-1-phosphate dehydratase